MIVNPTKNFTETSLIRKDLKGSVRFQSFRMSLNNSARKPFSCVWAAIREIVQKFLYKKGLTRFQNRVFFFPPPFTKNEIDSIFHNIV